MKLKEKFLFLLNPLKAKDLMGMSAFKKFILQIEEKNKNVTLEKRLFNLINLHSGLVITFLVGPANFYMNIGLLAQITNLACGLFLLACFFISYYKNKQLIKTFVFALLLFTDLLWLTNGGSLGPMTLFLGGHLIASIIFLKDNARVVVSIFCFINMIALLTIEKIYPQFITQYPGSDERFYDFLVGTTIIGVLLFLGVNLLMKSYEKERRELQEQNKILEELSLKDSLTGLYNRRFQMARLKEEVQKFQRYNHPFSILLIDIDHFKKINDTWGHQIGDQILQLLSEFLVNNLRTNDICGRYGGEEFLVIFPMTTLKDAANVAEKLRINVQKNITLPDKKSLTISIGVEDFRNELRISDLISRADKKLYHAKQTGRNKVIHIL